MLSAMVNIQNYYHSRKLPSSPRYSPFALSSLPGPPATHRLGRGPGWDESVWWPVFCVLAASERSCLAGPPQLPHAATQAPVASTASCLWAIQGAGDREGTSQFSGEHDSSRTLVTHPPFSFCAREIDAQFLRGRMAENGS